MTSVILMSPYSYSRNSDNNNNNVISILLAIPTHGNYDISTTTSFLTYQDPVYGIKIQYPSDWEKIEFTGGVEEGHRKIIINFDCLSESLESFCSVV